MAHLHLLLILVGCFTAQMSEATNKPRPFTAIGGPDVPMPEKPIEFIQATLFEYIQHKIWTAEEIIGDTILRWVYQKIRGSSRMEGEDNLDGRRLYEDLARQLQWGRRPSRLRQPVRGSRPVGGRRPSRRQVPQRRRSRRDRSRRPDSEEGSQEVFGENSEEDLDSRRPRRNRRPAGGRRPSRRRDPAEDEGDSVERENKPVKKRKASIFDVPMDQVFMKGAEMYNIIKGSLDTSTDDTDDDFANQLFSYANN